MVLRSASPREQSLHHAGAVDTDDGRGGPAGAAWPQPQGEDPFADLVDDVREVVQLPMSKPNQPVS